MPHLIIFVTCCHCNIRILSCTGLWPYRVGNKLMKMKPVLLNGRFYQSIDRTTSSSSSKFYFQQNTTMEQYQEKENTLYISVNTLKHCCICQWSPEKPQGSSSWQSLLWIVDIFECARMTEYPVISLGDLTVNYILDETLSTNPIHYIETAYGMHQLIDQPTRVDDKTSSVLDVILTSHPALHRKSAVLRYTLSDRYLIYTHMEFENTKPSMVDHNTVKFRDMNNFDMESFSSDLISCDILNGSQDNDNISWDRWKSAYNDICDKHAPMKTLRLKKRSNPWKTHDIIKLYVWTRPSTRQGYTRQWFKIMARLL